MWETLKPFPLFFGGAQNQPQTRWVYNFNGVDSYIQLPTINLSAGETFSFKFLAASTYAGGTNLFTDANSNDPSRLLVYLSGANPTLFRHNAGSGNLKLNGVVVDDGSQIDMNDTVYSVEYTVVSSRLVERLSARWDGTGFINLAIFDVKANDGSVYNFPINDRTFGAGAVIANTGTGADATGVNLLESGWTEINV